jgi:membrane protein implicated in regulation of membrane protease activity
MLTLYVITGIIGLGLIIFSAIGGMGDSHGDLSHDADVSHDLSTNHGLDSHDVSHSGDFWLPIFSLRFWTYFFGGFGGFGTLLTFLNVSSEPIRLFAALGVGLVVGIAAATIMRILIRNQISHSISDGDFVGVIAKVLVSPAENNPGKIRVEVKDESIDLLAIPMEGHQIRSGDEVVIVSVEGSTVTVAQSEQYLNS